MRRRHLPLLLAAVAFAGLLLPAPAFSAQSPERRA